MKTEEKRYDSNPELLKRYRSGDTYAGEELVTLNSPLVYRVAERFLSRHRDRDELIEIGTIGLVKAINTFDFSRECAFSTYAVPLIFGEIRRFLRDDGMIKVSREAKRRSAILVAERERRLNTGEEIGIAAIAEAVGVSSEDAALALFSQSPVRSLDEAAYEDDEGVTLGQTVFDEDEPVREFDRLALRMAIERLPTDSQRIIILRYFKDLSQEECARILGLSQVKVSREEKKILASLKKYME
jgi:RNA polymerase sporulation-specific sigma factor